MAATIFDVDVQLRPVLYRVDYDVPVRDGVVIDDYRIRRTLPTLDYLLKEKAKIIILSHLGRPAGVYNEEFSLRPVAEHLLGYYGDVQVQMTDSLFGEAILQSLQNMKPGSIFILGNTRFYPQEEQGDFEFAKSLSHLGELYVSDAFGAAHRSDATIAQLPKLMESYPGALLVAEVEALTRLRSHPKKPFTVIVGGAKLDTKIELIQRVISRADYILLGGKIANTFAKAAGQDIGSSPVEEKYLSTATQILKEAQGKLVLPVDYVSSNPRGKGEFLDIGQQTVKLFSQYINGSRDIFWNGTMGQAEDPRYASGSLGIAQALISANGLVTVAGGDTVAFVERNKLTKQFSFVSTGGGAALAYVAGQELPGLKAFNLGS